MKRVLQWAGAIVIGAASLMGCCCHHSYGGCFHDPYYSECRCSCCDNCCGHYCGWCGHYHYGPCH